MLFGVSFLTFYLIHLIPGDPAIAMVGFWGGHAQIAEIREALHLNDPLYIQYLAWMWSVLHGDLGRSYITNHTVSSQLAQRWTVTVELSVISLILGLAIGLATGVISALKRGSVLDASARAFAVLGYSLPTFWLALVLILGLSVYLRIAPVGGFVSFSEDPIGNLRAMIVPSIAIGIGIAAYLTRMVRSCLLEVLNKDYVRTARGKGLSERVIIYRHALRNAMIPVVTVLGLLIGFLLSGEVVVETIFSLPGIGSYLYSGINMRDYTVIQGTVLVIAVVFVACNLVVDIAYAYLNPKIRYAR